VLEQCAILNFNLFLDVQFGQGRGWVGPGARMSDFNNDNMLNKDAWIPDVDFGGAPVAMQTFQDNGKSAFTVLHIQNARPNCGAVFK